MGISIDLLATPQKSSEQIWPRWFCCSIRWACVRQPPSIGWTHPIRRRSFGLSDCCTSWGRWKGDRERRVLVPTLLRWGVKCSACRCTRASRAYWLRPRAAVVCQRPVFAPRWSAVATCSCGLIGRTLLRPMPGSCSRAVLRATFTRCFGRISTRATHTSHWRPVAGMASTPKQPGRWRTPSSNWCALPSARR